MEGLNFFAEVSSGGVRRKIVVDAALSHKIFVGAFLGYVAVFEDENPI